MVPTMQPPSGTWSPDVTARSNGAGRQNEIFGTPTITQQPFATPFNVGFGGIPQNLVGGYPYGAAIAPTYLPGMPINPFAAINQTINPFINGIPTTPFVNSTINPTINGYYPTTNPYITNSIGANCNPINSHPAIGSTLTPVCTTTIGSVVYRDCTTGQLCDSCCGPCTACVNPWTGTCTITPINCSPASCAIPCNTINTTIPSTITPFGINNTINPIGINPLNAMSMFLNNTRTPNTFGTPLAFNGINNGINTNPLFNTVGVNSAWGLNPWTMMTHCINPQTGCPVC